MLRQYNEKVARFIPEWILAGWDVASTLFRKKKNVIFDRFDYPQRAQGEIPFRCMRCCYFARSLEQSPETDLHSWTAYFKFLHQIRRHAAILTRVNYTMNQMAQRYALGQLMMNSTTVHREQEEMTRCTEVLWLCAAEVGMAGWSGWTHIVLIKTSDGANSSNGPERKWQKKRKVKVKSFKTSQCGAHTLKWFEFWPPLPLTATFIAQII